MFVFYDATKTTTKAPNVPDTIDWQFVQNELAAGKGMTTTAKNALHITGGLISAYSDFMVLIVVICNYKCIGSKVMRFLLV